MNLIVSNLSTIGAIVVLMALFAAVELVIPYQARGRWHRLHLRPNLALTFLTFATGLFLNTGLVLLLLWLGERGFGILRWAPIGPVAAGVLGVVVLELSYYLLHVAMHKVPAFWRVHRVHHSDPVVDVTTTVRQHPSEGLLRYGAMTLFACGFGVGIGAFAVYRGWSVLSGLFEHANVRLPHWLERLMSLATLSPGLHRIHHSRDPREADTNYGNILIVFDRVFGTFTPAARDQKIACGLDGFDDPKTQTTAGLLSMPFDEPPRIVV